MTEYEPGKANRDRSAINADDDALTETNVHRDVPGPIGVYDRPARTMPSMSVLLIGLLVLLALGYVAYIALF